MTDDDLLATARRFVGKWQIRLHLSEWRIRVGLYADPPAHDEAAITYSWREYRAYLRVRPDLPGWKRAGEAGETYEHESDEGLVEAAVVHELVHLTQLPLGHTFDRELKEWLGTNAAATSDTRTHWTDFVEMLTERTTRLLLEADRGVWGGG